MNCDKIKKLIDPYIDQTLKAETAQQIEVHLKFCSNCREEYQKMKNIVFSLNSLPQVSAPQNFTQKMMVQINKEKIEVSLSPVGYFKKLISAPRLSFRLAGGIALATVIIAFFAFSFIFNPPGISPICLSEVQFSLRLTGSKAQSIAIAGDFNQWDLQSNQLEDSDGDGVWIATLKLPPGRYEYMFVLDGKEWLPDPNASRFVKDGFGNKNAILEINNCT